MLLQACTARMNLSEEVDLEDYVGRPDKISNAEISAICQEAGMAAVRKNRCVSTHLQYKFTCLCTACFLHRCKMLACIAACKVLFYCHNSTSCFS